MPDQEAKSPKSMPYSIWDTRTNKQAERAYKAIVAAKKQDKPADHQTE
ncbi:hypothetical protein SAMN05192533_101421 [Mesobacillus persicus]|uniref:Uncharacterized protein n=1 Tax=Mesobacillus persicus TaxID=930146 RepID=A0A1H7WIP5_9BACI|nr:hypothetical protein [Mesobacillus persicus]SEM20868.1 hypothetical protein SAMN05192533_101421 [Mesobacillus persicus]